MPRTASRLRSASNVEPDTTPRYSDADLAPLLDALAALRDGDFRTEAAPAGGDGSIAEAAEMVEDIRERGRHLFGELSRVRREIGREGHLDERLVAGSGTGAWTSGVDAANSLLDALTGPANAMARVVEAVAAGDLGQRVDLRVDGRPLRGELLRMGRSVNHMVDQLDMFTSEVTQVAREVGTEGRLGGQAPARGMSGRWRDVTTAVNTMAGRLTAQVRDIAAVTTAVAKGDLTRKVTVEAAGELQELKLTVNTMVDQLSGFADEVTGMASNLPPRVRTIAQVATAVARGDLSRKITVDAQGEILELKDTLNTMVDQLSAFADEVTRVAREVGTEGRLGGTARGSSV